MELFGVHRMLLYASPKLCVCICVCLCLCIWEKHLKVTMNYRLAKVTN